MQKIKKLKVENAKTARISYRIDESTYKIVKDLAVKNNLSVSMVARGLLIEKLIIDRPKNIKIKR